MASAWYTRTSMAANTTIPRQTTLPMSSTAKESIQSKTMKIDKLLKRYRVDHGKHFRLSDHDPSDTHGLKSELKPQAKELLADGVKELSRLQDVLAAQDRWGLLLILQAMDAAGKDGTIKHVMSGVYPQGVQVTSFKTPTQEELLHGYLWRTSQHAPARGTIGIFNRSYYEEVLVVRVHPMVLENEKLPKVLVTKRIWQQRYEDINNFEDRKSVV